MFKFIKRLIYALPFGIKAADEQIAGNATDVTDGTHIQQQVEKQSMLNDLLKGEVTEEVEELRYRTYEVAEKSREYEYIGNGTAVKKDPKAKTKTIRFSQENKLIVSSVLDELKHVGDYGVEAYTSSINYNRFTRYKVEAYITMIDVLIKDETIQTKFHFNSTPNPYNANSAPFINELKRIQPAMDSSYALERNDIANSIDSLTFVTLNATNDEPNMIQYIFHGSTIKEYEERNGEIILTYVWDYFERNDLKEKFFSASMAKKYENKEKKDIVADANTIVKNDVCHICGKEIPSYLQGLVDRENGKPICLECLNEKVNHD